MNASFSQVPSTRAVIALVDGLILIAILAIVGLIVLPRQLRERQRSQAAHALQDIHTIDQALDQWTSKHARVDLPISNFQSVVRPDRPFASMGSAEFGHPFGLSLRPGDLRQILPVTLEKLSERGFTPSPIFTRERTSDFTTQISD